MRSSAGAKDLLVSHSHLLQLAQDQPKKKHQEEEEEERMMVIIMNDDKKLLVSKIRRNKYPNTSPN